MNANYAIASEISWSENTLALRPSFPCPWFCAGDQGRPGDKVFTGEVKIRPTGPILPGINVTFLSSLTKAMSLGPTKIPFEYILIRSAGTLTLTVKNRSKNCNGCNIQIVGGSIGKKYIITTRICLVILTDPISTTVAFFTWSGVLPVRPRKTLWYQRSYNCDRS